MKSNLAILFLGISGLLQLSSISCDQYVIQQENKLRNLSNEITVLSDQIDQIIASNISFGRFSYNRLLQVREVVWGEDLKKPVHIETLRLLNDEHLNKVNALVYNKYLPRYDNFDPLAIHKDIDTALTVKTLTPNESSIDEKFLQYQDILVEMYKSSLLIKEKRKSKFELQKIIAENKFTLLVLGMMCNIASIFFLFSFFYGMIKRDHLSFNH